MADLNKKEIEELRRLINLLEKDIKGVDFDNLIKSGTGAKTLLNSLRKEAEEFTSDISYAAEGFRKVVGEIRKTDEGLRIAGKSFNKLADIADKVKYHQLDISKLTLKEVGNLQKKAQQEKKNLETANNLLKDKASSLQSNLDRVNSEIESLTSQNSLTDTQYKRLGDLLKRQEKLETGLSKNEAIQRNIAGTIEDQDALYNGLVSSLDRINNELEEEKKKLGLTGALLEGLNKIPFLNGIIDTNEALDAAKDKIKEGGNRFQAMSAALSTVGKQILTHLTDPLFIVGFLVTEIISAFKSVDSAIGDMAKGLDMSYNSAANLRMELTDIANFSGDVAVNTRGLQESLMAVSQTMGVNARLSAQDLVTFTKLREQAGYTNDELVAIQKISTINGKTVEATSKSFLGTVDRLNAQNKSAINAKQLFKEIVNVSDAIKLSVGGTAEKLAEAAYKAKQFGITLQQADNIAESLLNFESSIANELSAELITGKDLNFERARLLAINGDIAGASEEILKQIKGSAEFTKMNRVQQEAIAKAVGMSRDDLAKSLVEREAAAALGAEEGQAAQDRYNELVRIHGVEKANDILGNKALERQFQQQSVQDRLANAAEKLKEIFISLVEPLMPIVDAFTDIFGFIAPAVGLIGTIVKYTVQWGKYLLPIYGIYKGIQIANMVNTALMSSQAGIYKVHSVLAEKSLATKVMGNAVLLTQLVREQGIAGIKTYALSLDEKSLTRRIIMGTLAAKDFVMQKALAIQTGYRMVMENTIVGAILKQGAGMLKNIAIGAVKLVQSMAIAAAELMGVSAATLGIGTAIAVAAAVAGYAVLKSMKGDDVVSEGGYGNRTLLTPKGSIALNNQDTVIAGTNLGGKGKSTPAPQQDNSALLNEMKAMRQEQAKANSKPTIVENSMNGTRFGTSVAMNTYKIQ